MCTDSVFALFFVEYGASSDDSDKPKLGDCWFLEIKGEPTLSDYHEFFLYSYSLYFYTQTLSCIIIFVLRSQTERKWHHTNPPVEEPRN